jgi:hypothetical protein
MINHTSKAGDSRILAARWSDSLCAQIALGRQGERANLREVGVVAVACDWSIAEFHDSFAVSGR